MESVINRVVTQNLNLQRNLYLQIRFLRTELLQNKNGRGRKHGVKQINGKQHESQYNKGQRKKPRKERKDRSKGLKQIHRNARLLGIKVRSIALDEKAFVDYKIEGIVSSTDYIKSGILFHNRLHRNFIESMPNAMLYSAEI